MLNNHIYKRFRALDFPRGAVGLALGSDNATYFCTPVDAEIIGWVGVDGIHFCFIPSISSDIVFAVSPMPCGEHYVEPIASGFQDFLSLVLFCRDASILEQICWMDENCFCETLKSAEENECSDTDIALNTLRSEFGVDVQLNAYQYVKSLQADFDYASIPFSDEYYELLGIAR